MQLYITAQPNIEKLYERNPRFYWDESALHNNMI